MSEPAKGLLIRDHKCPLKFYNYTEKLNSAYSGGFNCNICRKTYNNKIDNFHCTSCEYDICDKCLANEIDKEVKSL